MFNFSDLKTYGGADIQAIYKRWIAAKAYFSVYGVNPISFYPEILLRERQLKSLLTSIPSDRHEDVQARLVFEIQATFLVECLDLLLDEIIHKRGRIQQSLNASRQKVENDLRKSALDLIRAAIKEIMQKPSSDMEKLYLLSETISEDIKARMILLRRHKESYHLILNLIENLMSILGDDIVFHIDEGLNFYRLASGKTRWEYLDEVTKRRLTKNPTLTRVIGDGNEDIAQFLAYCFQDIGSRIEEIRVEEGDGFLTNDILEQLIAGTFLVDIWPLCETGDTYEEIEDLTLPSWVDLSSVLKEVSKYVRENTPKKNLLKDYTRQ